MVAEREEAGASSVHHLDRATIRQIENTLPGIQYRECKSENTSQYKSVSRRAADHMCRRAVYQLPVPSTATAAEKQIFK